MDIERFRITKQDKFKLTDIDPEYTGKFKDKEEAEEYLAKNIEKIVELQGKLYADDHYALLLVFQAMDTAGKDSTIKHVMSGLNPQGTQVYSFKQPSSEELDHDYLWRSNKCLPEKGRIGIFNRSYYEEVLVVRVHNLLAAQRIPAEYNNDHIWAMRFRQIKDQERYLHENGIIPLKFFLHISKEEQKERLIKRIEDQTKNWKFSEADLEERTYWDNYQKCYEEMIKETSTNYAPWHVIPANKKWFARLVVSEIVVQAMEDLKFAYPKLNKEQLQKLKECKERLLNE